MAWDRYQKTGRGNNVNVEFWTGMPGMFAVKKYGDALEKLRIERGVTANFQHNLVAVDHANRKATFKKADGSTVDTDYTLLHVVPPMGPPDVIKNSPLADEAGWVSVDKETLRHVNPEFGNVWSLGDCSSLPTSKTAAAVTSEAPILTENLFSVVDTGKVAGARYDGYTSCPVRTSMSFHFEPTLILLGTQLLTGYGQLLLAEFKYGGEPKETFANYLGDQATPRRFFYHLKKDLFPWAYWNLMVRLSSLIAGQILSFPNFEFTAWWKMVRYQRSFPTQVPRLSINGSKCIGQLDLPYLNDMESLFLFPVPLSVTCAPIIFKQHRQAVPAF